MHKYRLSRSLCLLSLSLALCAALPAQAAKKRKASSDETASTYRYPGGESVRDRDRRLLRECKGRPNAGACAGYAH